MGGWWFCILWCRAGSLVIPIMDGSKARNASRMQSCSRPVDPRPLTLAKTRRVVVSGFGRIIGSPQGMMAGLVVKV